MRNTATLTAPPRSRNGRAPLQLDADQVVTNLPMEQSTLGALLADNEQIDPVRELLQADDFANGWHRTTFELLCEFRDREEPADLFTVERPLQERLGLEREEIARYLVTLVNAGVPHTNAPYFAQQVALAAQARRGEGVGGQLQKLFREAGTDRERITEAVQTARVLIEDLERRGQLRRGPTVYTAAQLRDMQFPPLVWLVEKLLPLPGFALIAGAPKTKKSFWALDLGCALAQGGRALGKLPVPQTSCLCCFTEDSFEEVRERLKRQFGETDAWPENLHVTDECPRMDEGGEAWLHNFLTQHPEIHYVVLDPLINVRGAGRNSEGNAYSADYDDLGAFKRIVRQHRVALVVIHHINKRASTGDPFALISGTRGINGAVDVEMVLEVKDSEVQHATLHARGRRVRPLKWALAWDDHVGWVYEGEARDEQPATAEQQDVLQVLAERGEPMQFRDLVQAVMRRTGCKESAAKMRVTRMRDAGILSAQGGIYWLPQPGHSPEEGVTGVTGVTESLPRHENGLFSGHMGGVTDVTSHTRSHRSQAVTPVTPGHTDPGPPPEELDLSPDLQPLDAERRRRLFDEAWRRGFPFLDLGAGMSVHSGEDAWRQACVQYGAAVIDRARQRLGGTG